MLAAAVLGFIFEILFELVFEVVFEFLFQLIGDAIIRPLWRRFGSQRRKRALIAAFVGLVAFGYGVGWGIHRATQGADGLPRSVWVTLAMAIGFGALASSRSSEAPGRTRPDLSPTSEVTWARLQAIVLPWHWEPGRLRSFAAANLAIAAGIPTGYLAVT